jgi:c-di-GMP-binding flagellar brake protein YcgR
MIAKAKLTGEERNQETQDFLAKLYEYRKKIEFEHPRYKKGITSSKSIEELQPIRVLLDGAGVFSAQVLRNSDRFITISLPAGISLPNKFSWKTKRIAVYFWRRNDAGYVFDTYVLDEVESRTAPVLHIAHSDSLFRTQKRKSIRTKMHKGAFLYLPQGEEPPEKIETDRGLKCLMEDISETGCAVTIGGKAAAGLRVKVQFELDGSPIAMTGLVRSTEYNEETKRSLLHIEAEPLSLATRNLILSEVFGVRPEDHLPSSFDLFDTQGPEEEKKADADRSDFQGEPVLPMEETNE